MASGLFAIGRWRSGHLLLAWGAYWVGLAAAVLGPAVPAILRASGASGDKGSISAAMGDEGVRLLVSEGGATLWSGTASLSAIALSVVGPPLVLWMAWVIRRRGARDETTPAARRQAELPLPHAEDVVADRSTRERANQPPGQL